MADMARLDGRTPYLGGHVASDKGAQEGRLTLGWGPHRSVPSVLASELVSAQAGVGGGRGCTTTGINVGTTIGAGVTTPALL